MAKGQKAAPRSEWMEETRTKQNEWKKKHRSVLGADLPKEQADLFRNICKRNNVSVSAALSVFVCACIRFNSLNVIRDDGTTATGSIRDNDGRRDDPPGQKNIDPAFPHGDQASENDTHGTVDSHPVSDTPGPVD